MSWRRLTAWIASITLAALLCWLGTLFWFNELRFHFNPQPPSLAAALAAKPAVYICGRPPLYNDVDDQIRAAEGVKLGQQSRVLEIWKTKMAKFEICSRTYLEPALKMEADIESALKEPLAISQRDALHSKQRILDKHLSPAKKMARSAAKLKVFNLDGEWGESFLKDLQKNDPVGYSLITREPLVK